MFPEPFDSRSEALPAKRWEQGYGDENDPLSWTNNALYTILSVICAMQIMSATHADTYINALMNTRDLSSGSTSEINMGGTQATYLVVSISYGSVRASLTA